MKLTILVMMIVAMISMADAIPFFASRCDDIMARENINRKEFAFAAGHLTHSLYLEPLRFDLDQWFSMLD
jgi:hypothetical protein